MAKDIYHDVVKHALIKDGWTITDDPLEIKPEGVKLLIDLGAEKLIGAAKAHEKIAVEVKVFGGFSFISQFHTALGQFLNYRRGLELIHPDRQLFLAVPIDTYDISFDTKFVRRSVEEHNITLIVYDPVEETIKQWVK